MTIAFEAEARSTSLSVIAPTPEWMTLIRTFSVDIFASESANTCTEPCTSPLRISGSSFMPACLI